MADDLNKQENKMAMIGMSVKTMSDFVDLFVLHLTVADRPLPRRTRRAPFEIPSNKSVHFSILIYLFIYL